MNELYLCPLCAGEALLETVEAHQHTIAKFMPDYPGGAIAQCLKCSLAIMREGPDAVAEVTAAWNTRTELRALGGGWLPIESAPTDGTEFQVWFDKYGWVPRCRVNDNGMIEVFGRVDYDMDGWETCFHMRATHWMSFPTPPSATVEG